MFIQQLNLAQQGGLYFFSKQLIAPDNHNVDDTDTF